LGDIASWLGIIAGVLFPIGFFRYGQTIWKYRHASFGTKGKPEPQKVTWLIWVSLDTITFLGMFVKGTLNGQIIATMLAWPLVVLGVIYGKKGWAPLDVFCLAGAVLGILLWQLFGDATFGIITTCFIVFFGSFPVFVSAWDKPEGEDKWAWLIFWVSCVFQMIAVWLNGVWTLDVAAQPISFAVIETILMYELFVRPNLRSTKLA
jgi:hypothetical protein